MNRDGSMARGADLVRFCSEYGFTMVTVAQLVRYRLETELKRPPIFHPFGADGHAPDWDEVLERSLENDAMHGNSTTGDLR
jgi:hypothetical protein